MCSGQIHPHGRSPSHAGANPAPPRGDRRGDRPVGSLMLVPGNRTVASTARAVVDFPGAPALGRAIRATWTRARRSSRWTGAARRGRRPTPSTPNVDGSKRIANHTVVAVPPRASRRLTCSQASAVPSSPVPYRGGVTSVLRLVEFPADDPARARGFWGGHLDVDLEDRVGGEGEGWQTHGGGSALGLHPRGTGPGESGVAPVFLGSRHGRGAAAGP